MGLETLLNLGARNTGSPPLRVCETITLKTISPAQYALTIGFYPDQASAMSLVNEITEHTIGEGEVWVAGDLYQLGFINVPVNGADIEIYIDGKYVDTFKTVAPLAHYYGNITEYLDKLSEGKHEVCAVYKG